MRLIINHDYKEIIENKEIEEKLINFFEKMGNVKRTQLNDKEISKYQNNSKYYAIAISMFGLLEKKRKIYQDKISLNFPIPDKELNLVDLFQYTPLELARQLTLIDSFLFQNIQTKELLNWKGFSNNNNNNNNNDNNNNNNAPNILNLIHHFATVSLSFIFFILFYINVLL